MHMLAHGKAMWSIQPEMRDRRLDDNTHSRHAPIQVRGQCASLQLQVA